MIIRRVEIDDIIAWVLAPVKKVYMDSVEK